MELTLVPYQATTQSNITTTISHVRYKQCMKNYAASLGGHANDGCVEFMPCGGGDDHERLTCAACGCHRNFHRKEYYDHLLLMPPKQVIVYKDEHDHLSETPERGGEVNVGSGGGSCRGKSKRIRTKFTQAQKDRMMEFAEKIGWRIQRHHDLALNQFCTEVGVKRNVVKVWMHNNKNLYRRITREEAPPLPPPSPVVSHPPPPPQPLGV